MSKRPVSTDLNKHINEMPNVQKLLHKRRLVHRYVTVLIVILIAIICIEVGVFLRNPSIQIYSITVSGNQIVDSDAVIAAAQQTLSGKYFYLIPRTNIFFYPKKQLLQDIQTEFPRFESVDISLVNKNTLAITVTEERGKALWCGPDSDPLDMTAACYFTDTEGKIIDIAPYYSGNVYLRFFGGTHTVIGSSPLGQSFVDPDLFGKLTMFANEVEGLGFQIQAVRITGSDEDYFVLDLGGGNTALVEFKGADDYDTLYSNLHTALSQPDLAKQVAADKTNLQYFDLRFKNKVYYKFNDGSAPIIATSTKKS